MQIAFQGGLRHIHSIYGAVARVKDAVGLGTGCICSPPSRLGRLSDNLKRERKTGNGSKIVETSFSSSTNSKISSPTLSFVDSLPPHFLYSSHT